jgi:hypothetical protein
MRDLHQMAAFRARCREAGPSLIFKSSMRTVCMKCLQIRLLCQFFHGQILGSRVLVVYQTILEVKVHLLEE